MGPMQCGYDVGIPIGAWGRQKKTRMIPVMWKKQRGGKEEAKERKEKERNGRDTLGWEGMSGSIRCPAISYLGYLTFLTSPA